jgi:ubiquitin-conjugating enzyme E2 S
LKKDWNPAKWSLSNIFEVIKCLLIVPFPESSLNEEAGKQFMEDYSQFCETARVYTDVHAGKAPVSQPVIELDNAGAAEIEETK